jgi:hypothetical protein
MIFEFSRHVGELWEWKGKPGDVRIEVAAIRQIDENEPKLGSEGYFVEVTLRVEKSTGVIAGPGVKRLSDGRFLVPAWAGSLSNANYAVSNLSFSNEMVVAGQLWVTHINPHDKVVSMKWFAMSHNDFGLD